MTENERNGIDRMEIHYRQQLCALIDGDLPPDEARFLLRRLQHDAELGGCWERWQMIGEALRAEALSVTPLIAIGALLSGLTTYYFLQAFTLARKTKLLVVAMSIPAISNIALNILLIPRYGLIGAAAASALSFALGLIGAWLIGLKAIALPVPLRPLVLTALATAVMALAVIQVPAWGGIAELSARAITGAVVYGVLAWILNLNAFRDGASDILRRIKAKVAA